MQRVFYFCSTEIRTVLMLKLEFFIQCMTNHITQLVLPAGISSFTRVRQVNRYWLDMNVNPANFVMTDSNKISIFFYYIEFYNSSHIFCYIYFSVVHVQIFVFTWVSMYFCYLECITFFICFANAIYSFLWCLQVVFSIVSNFVLPVWLTSMNNFCIIINKAISFYFYNCQHANAPSNKIIFPEVCPSAAVLFFYISFNKLFVT